MLEWQIQTWAHHPELSTEVKNSVTNLFIAANLLNPETRHRSALGSVLQDTSVRPWERSIIWATVMAILPSYKQHGWTEDCDLTVDRFVDLRRYIKQTGLAQDIDRPPLLNVSARLLLNRVLPVLGS